MRITAGLAAMVLSLAGGAVFAAEDSTEATTESTVIPGDMELAPAACSSCDRRHQSLRRMQLLAASKSKALLPAEPETTENSPETDSEQNDE